MPDFDIVRLRVPYRAAFNFRGEARELVVDEAFEVPVVSVSRRAAPLAVSIVDRRDFSKPETFEFLNVEGRLFRPLRIEDRQGPWTLDRCREEPPQIDLCNTRWIGGLSTGGFGSPARSGRRIVAPDFARRQAREAAPKAYDDARRRRALPPNASARLDGGCLSEVATDGLHA